MSETGRQGPQTRVRRGRQQFILALTEGGVTHLSCYMLPEAACFPFTQKILMQRLISTSIFLLSLHAG